MSIQRYTSIPEYRAHRGCTHPVHDHGGHGCKTWSCNCNAPRSQLAGPAGARRAADVVLRLIGALWLLHILWVLILWVIA